MGIVSSGRMIGKGFIVTSLLCAAYSIILVGSFTFRNRIIQSVRQDFPRILSPLSSSVDANNHYETELILISGDAQPSKIDFFSEKTKLDSSTPPRSTREFTARLSALAKDLNNVTAVFLLLEDMQARNVPLHLITLNTVLSACAKHKQHYNLARQLLDRMNRGEFMYPHYYNNKKKTLLVPIRPDEISYNAVLRSCNDPTEAIHILREMRNTQRLRVGAVPPSVISYTYALTICKDFADLNSAKKILHIAHDAGTCPNVYMYSTYIWTAERCGDFHEAMNTLNLMRSSSKEEEDVQPNIVSYNGVLSACCKSSRTPEEVLALYIQLKREVTPNSKTFQILLHFFDNCTFPEKQPCLEKVMESFTTPEERRRDGIGLMKALVEAYSENRLWQNVTQSIQKYYAKDDICILAVLHLLVTKTNAPANEVSLQVVQMLRTSLALQQAITLCVMTYSKDNQWEDAMAALHLVGESDYRLVVPVAALNSLISSCGRNGRADMALQVLHEMNFKYGVNPNTRSFRAAIMACNQAQHAASATNRNNKKRQRRDDSNRNNNMDVVLMEWWECALSLLRRMKEEGLQPDLETYSSAISACEAAGKWQRALGIVNDMEKDGRIAPNYVCINAAFSACEKGGAWVEALELYERMKQRQRSSTSRPSFVTINSLLICLDKAGQREMAENIYREAIADGVVSHWKEDIDENRQGINKRMDLHQFSAPMSKIAVLFVLESLLSSTEDAGLDPTKDDLIIVVGKGKGSSRGVPVLMPTISNLLKELDIAFRFDSKNSGRVIIPNHELVNFMKKRSWID